MNIESFEYLNMEVKVEGKVVLNIVYHLYHLIRLNYDLEFELKSH